MGLAGSSAERKLLFRLDKVGFVLSLSHVVEICKRIDNDLNLSCRDLPQGIIGALHFRQTRIPVVDPTIRLDVSSPVPLQEKAILVLKSAEGNWGLLVDEIVGIKAGEQFDDCPLPPLLKGALSSYYQKILLCEDEPFIVFEPEHYYGLAGSNR